MYVVELTTMETPVITGPCTACSRDIQVRKSQYGITAGQPGCVYTLDLLSDF